MDFQDRWLYLDITGQARDAPAWLRHTAEIWTEGGLLLFALLFVTAWWRARRGDSRAFAIAVLAPVATAVAYVGSELLKSVITEERPCRAVAGAARSLAECPPHGDWSFPSNHATIAGAAALSLALVRRAVLWLTAPLALLMAYSRVFVGVHYPHDVAAGLLLGALVAVLVLRLGTGPLIRLVVAVRGSSAPVARWLTGPGPGTAPGRAPAYATHRRS